MFDTKSIKNHNAKPTPSKPTNSPINSSIITSILWVLCTADSHEPTGA